MKTFTHAAAQGELYLERIDKFPDDLKEIKSENNRLIVGHSETGHHHYVEKAQARFFGTDDPNICYLHATGKYADLIHDRSFDTHETLRIPAGFYRVRKQKEYTLE